MQKNASSKASRQASAPRTGAPKEELSEKHMVFTFYIITWVSGKALGTSPGSSPCPPAYLYTPLSSQDSRVPQPLTLQMIDHKFPTSLLRKENQARPKPLFVHTTPSLSTSPSRLASAQNYLFWCSSFLLCHCISRNKLSLPSPCSFLNVWSPFGKTTTWVFHLLAAPCPFFTNTRSVQIDHILIWNSLCSVTCPNMNKCEGKELFHVIIIENSLPVKSCYFHKDRDCLDQGREVRFRSWGEWCVVIITLKIFAAVLIQRSEPCLQYITTAGYVILCKLLPKFHNSCNKQESLN